MNRRTADGQEGSYGHFPATRLSKSRPRKHLYTSDRRSNRRHIHKELLGIPLTKCVHSPTRGRTASVGEDSFHCLSWYFVLAHSST